MKMKILLEACVWTPPWGYCECVHINVMPVWTEAWKTAEMDIRGQKPADVTRMGQSEAKMTRKSPKWPQKGQQGRTITEMAGQLPHRGSNSPTQPDNHRNSQETGGVSPMGAHWRPSAPGAKELPG